MTVTLDLDRVPSAWGAYGRALFGRRPGMPTGTTLPRFEARIRALPPEPARLKAYRALCGFVDDGVLPMPYPQLFAGPLHLAMLTHPAFPFPVLGLVHVRNAIVQHVPIPDAATLALRCHVEGHTEVTQGVEFAIHTEAEVDRVRVWEAVTTVLQRTRSAKPRTQGAPRPAREAARGEDPGAMRSAIWRLPEDLGRRYARVTGDFNPIHQHALAARPFGFPRAIIHGTWSMGRAVAELTDDAPAGPTQLDVRFRKPILLPSSALFTARQETDGASFTLSDPGATAVHLDGSWRSLPTS